MLHCYVQLGCLHEQVTLLPVQIALGQNQITKAYNHICSSI